jgi:ubiquitin-protein ligase
MVHKRLPKDIDLLKKNEEYLQTKGIYFYVNDHDMTKISVLVSPRHKEDTTVTPKLQSPYTGGFFVFELSFPSEYPMSPPGITFNPKQTMCRLHPDYYTTGKVCLSIINTWGSHDWSPSMSLLSLLMTLEERFFERALGCEPGHGMSSLIEHKTFNDIVEYSKYKVAILDVLANKYAIYRPFKDIIVQELQNTMSWHISRIDELIQSLQDKTLESPTYGNTITCNYVSFRDQLQTAMLSCQINSMTI